MNHRFFKHVLRPGVLLLLVTALLPGCVTTGSGAERAVLRAKAKVAPALVHIRPVKEVYARGKREEVLTIGSGFIISSDGYVVTNEHVAGDSTMVHCVLSDKSETEAKVVGVDPFTDVAVLKLEVDRSLPYVVLGDSDTLESGQTVMALGSPHGLARSVSLGIVSVTDRYLEERDEDISPYNNWIQTDAAINPGNSGGPLVNLRGEVVGVNARRLGGADNVGFAIPINTAREVIEGIIREGRVQRSWLGLSFQEMLARTDDPSQQGVVIADVDPLSPGYEAGFRPGDILLAVNGVPANARFEEDLPNVRKIIADLPIGQKAVLTVLRGTEQKDIEALTEEQVATQGREREFAEWGFTATEVTPAVARRAQLPARQGIMITGTQVGGLAATARLERSDIVLEVDGVPVEDAAHFRRLYDERIESGKTLTLLFVKKGALTRYVLIKQGIEGDRDSRAPVNEGVAEHVE